MGIHKAVVFFGSPEDQWKYEVSQWKKIFRKGGDMYQCSHCIILFAIGIFHVNQF